MQVRQQRVEYWNISVRWFFNGKSHRDGDLPAHYFFKDKRLYSVSYCQHGIDHRATGPAYINYKRKIKGYCYNGKLYASLGELLMMEACR